MTEYKTVSRSSHFMEIAEPVVIEEHETTRKVIVVGINDAKVESGEIVSITIVHQRKKKKDEWEDVKSINLNTLKGGEGVKLKLDSKSTKKLFDKLNELYCFAKEKGVVQGINKFSIEKADEIVKVTGDRKIIIERLLSENYGEEVWNELVDTDSDLATKLSNAKLHANRKTILSEFNKSISDNTKSESYWQDFFMKNDWIFGYGLNYHFLNIVEEQPDYGGRKYTGKGSQRGDYLTRTSGETKFTVLVEIKTPKTQLFTYKKNGQLDENRNGACLLSRYLLGGVSQVQINSRTWSIESQDKKNASTLERQNTFTVQPKGILVIGNSSELTDNEDKVNTFEEYRRNIYNPEIITFDELYERAKFIVESKTSDSTESE